MSFRALKTLSWLRFAICLLLAVWLQQLPWFAHQVPWTLLVLLAGHFSYPGQIGLGCIWLIGLMMDVLLGTPLGLQAGIYTGVLYLAGWLFPRPIQGSFIHVMPWVLGLVFLMESVWALGQGFPSWWAFFLPLAYTTVGWPLVDIALKKIKI